MRQILPFLILLFCIDCFSQDYKYLGVENGLSNRKVYSIQKDKKGYMWFLTHEGIDRFNGSSFKHYSLEIDGKDINSFASLNQLHKDTTGCIWAIGQNGQLFKYNYLLDKFQFISNPSENNKGDTYILHYTYIDNNNNIWLCNKDRVFLYNINTNKFSKLINCHIENINCVEQINPNTYYICSQQGIYKAELIDESLRFIPNNKLETFPYNTSTVYYHKPSKKLVIGSFLKGIYIYDEEKDSIFDTSINLNDVYFTRIRAFDDKNILIATDAVGIHKLDIYSHEITPYIVSDHSQSNQMDGNNINEIYVDDEGRIWMANYPIGITVFDNRYPQYEWIKHSFGNANSLINNQVNYILEDSDGDLWFATNNGISCFNTKTKRWNNMLSTFQQDTKNPNHIFLSICEAKPGVFLVGGYISGMYLINKKDFKPEYFTIPDIKQADKYIRAIFKDSHSRIWTGGHNNLVCYDINGRRMESIYYNFQNINTIIEKDPTHLWIGCNDGLYLFNIDTGESSKLQLPIESNYINTLYQSGDGSLYIGTGSSGLLIYTPKKNFIIYHKGNSALISNNIQCILPNDGDLLLSTEKSLSQYFTRSKTFRNWTKEQGLMAKHFNANAGIMTRDNKFLFGTGEGVIQFSKNIHLPEEYKSALIFSDFQLFYQTVSAGEKHSPLTKDINEMTELILNHDQNIFSLRLSSINYDHPSNVVYSWKLDGFYSEWSKPSHESLVRYTNLSPGKYTLYVRAISEENSHVIEERSIDIIIKPPFWLTIWAMVIYCLIFGFLCWLLMRYYFIRKEGKISADKIQFFVNTAHDIRTPLSLIKAPLDELMDKEELSPKGEANLLLAIRNTNNLYQLVSNLINFEKANMYSFELLVEEHELYSFIEETIKSFKSYADSKQVKLTFEANFTFLGVWFDKSKMESILKNLITNAIKYTPADGSVHIKMHSDLENWSIEIIDTGIGIPPSEQKKLFKTFFRGSNATNLKVPGSGIGLLMVKKMVELMKGTIRVKSSVNLGSSFKVTFPQGNSHYKKSQIKEKTALVNTNSKVVSEESMYEHIPESKTEHAITVNPNAPRILIVDDNDELREYLRRSLSEKYNVTTAFNGKEAFNLVPVVNPHLIISDVMMPEMRGDELCLKLKSDMDTSHIPIILLSALTDRNNILEGLASRADEYLTKPFDISILKAIISNLLENRSVLAKKFAKLEVAEVTYGDDDFPDLDHVFMTRVKENIEKNMNKSDFNVDTLCSDLGMSRSSFYNKIKVLTDQAPADFIREQRMNRAAHLLRSKQYTITEISDMVGFSDAKYFREVFKKHFGTTPSQYISDSE